MNLPTFPAPKPPWLILWLIGFFAFLNVYSMQAVLPQLMQDFQASPTQAGATVGATVLAIALVSPFIGMLSDAFGRKVVVCSSMFLLSLPTVLIPAVSSLNEVIALRFIQGLAVPGIAVVTIAYIGEEFRMGGLARMMSLYVGGTVMGGFSGRFITGHASDFLGWRGAFLLLASLNLLGACLAAWRLPASRNFVPNRNLKQALAMLGRHLRNRRLWAVCAVGFCVLLSLVGTFTYVNLHLAAEPFQLSPAGLANVFCVYLVGAVVTPLTGRLIGRYGLLPSLMAAMGLSCAGLLLTLAPSLAAVVVGLTVCSSGIFVCQSATISHLSNRVTEGRSLATGLYYLSYYTGGAVGAWLVGLAYESWHWTGSVITIAAFQALAVLIATRFLRTPARTA